MAISTNSAIHFFGTQDAVTTTGSSTTDGSFTSAGSWTNDDDAPMASATGVFTFATAPDTNSTVDLYARLDNVQSTNDNEAPDADHLATFMGSFQLNNVTTAQYITIDIALPNAYTSQVYNFYIHNNGGQTISANWSLYITPKTIGPHA